MCCLTFLLHPKLLKLLLFLTGLAFLGSSGWMIYMGVLCKQSGLWRIMSDNSMFHQELDLQLWVTTMGIAAGCVCFIMAFAAFVSSFQPYKACYLPLGFFSFLLSGVLICVGTTVYKIGNDLLSTLDSHCSMISEINFNNQSTVYSQIMIDIEDAYIKYADETLCS